MSKPVLRLCEWETCETKNDLSAEQRIAIGAASERWRVQNKLNAAPLVWEGANGTRLKARQFVGVVEAGGVAVEIYPKLDKTVLGANTVFESDAPPVLHRLLWMMQTADAHMPPPADSGALAEEPLSFADIWAWLLARNLEPELRRGALRRYVTLRDDLHTVRGRIRVGEQAARLFDRYDKTACEWQEFTADIAVNRVLLCACHHLRTRVRSRRVRGLLENCAALLDETEWVDPGSAVRGATPVPRFDRTAARFEPAFRLALRLLGGVGQNLRAGQTDMWVFLQDMNVLWEGYVGALLRARFGGNVAAQETIGYLTPNLSAGKIAQKPDFLVRGANGAVWIADAKYKHLAAGQDRPLRFEDVDREAGEEAAGRRISPDDVRQLTVYAEIAVRGRGLVERPALALLYPFVGGGELLGDTATAWNGSLLTLAPVGVDPALGWGNLPAFAASSASFLSHSPNPPPSS